MAINRRDRVHLALHLGWAERGGPAPWICRLLRWLGACDCRTFSRTA